MTLDMTFKDIVSQLLERGNAMQTFWGFYITVSLGLIAFMSSAKLGERLWQVASILTIAFVAFAAANCGGMTDVARQRQFFYDLLPKAAQSDINAHLLFDAAVVASLRDVTKPPTPHSVRNFHIAADLLVVAAMWILVVLRWGPEAAVARKSDSHPRPHH